MRPFSILLKPVGSACNLDCSYCFYANHPSGCISEKTLEKLLQSYCDLPFREKSIALQGGEPLLAPNYVFKMIETAPVSHSLQTNATLITQEKAEQFKLGNWLIGASIDGAQCHNILRKTKQGDPSKAFNDTVQGIKNLEKACVDYNLLTVVSSANANSASEIYTFLRDNFATRYHQYIECTGPSNEITGAQWGKFLCELFDEWIKRDTRTVSIRLFDSIVSKLVQGFHTQCSQAPSCGGYFVVEHDGSVYPCDFHVRDDLKLGNVTTDSWEEIARNATAKNFASAKDVSHREPCASCKYLHHCNGDCPKNRRADRSILCEGWKKFFDHSIEKFCDIINSIAL